MQSKIERKLQSFPIPTVPQHRHSLPHHGHPHRSSTFVTVDTPAPTRHHSGFMVNIEFAPRDGRSEGLGKCTMTHIHLLVGPGPLSSNWPPSPLAPAASSLTTLTLPSCLVQNPEPRIRGQRGFPVRAGHSEVPSGGTGPFGEGTVPSSGPRTVSAQPPCCGLLSGCELPREWLSGTFHKTCRKNTLWPGHNPQR